MAKNEEKTVITFRFEKNKINNLKRIALDESINTDKNVLYTELIKRAINEKYFKGD